MMAGYHITDIPKGTIGELSKIQEELFEAFDAESQGCKIMVLIELSDLLGAIELYLEKHHQNISLMDLQLMNEITRRAFETGYR